jgi:hypothetical protein
VVIDITWNKWQSWIKPVVEFQLLLRANSYITSKPYILALRVNAYLTHVRLDLYSGPQRTFADGQGVQQGVHLEHDYAHYVCGQGDALTPS